MANHLNRLCEMYRRPDGPEEPGCNYGMFIAWPSNAPYISFLSRDAMIRCNETGSEICKEEDADGDCSPSEELFDLLTQDAGTW